MFEKKEKPILEYSLTEICSKTLDTKDFSYIPTKVTYYETRVEFCIDRINRDLAESISFTVSAARSDERLLPLDIDGVTLYWDLKDNAFRVKCLPEGNPTPLIPQVLLYPNEVMAMEREFAEKNLSRPALSYATLHEDNYIWYYPDGSAAPAVFELPRLFAVFSSGGNHPLSGHASEVASQLATYTPSYIEENGLTLDNILYYYNENFKKGK